MDSEMCMKIREELFLGTASPTRRHSLIKRDRKQRLSKATTPPGLGCKHGQTPPRRRTLAGVPRAAQRPVPFSSSFSSFKSHRGSAETQGWLSTWGETVSEIKPKDIPAHCDLCSHFKSKRSGWRATIKKKKTKKQPNTVPGWINFPTSITGFELGETSKNPLWFFPKFLSRGLTVCSWVSLGLL